MFYKIPLLGKKNIARDTMLFSFRRPEGFSFEAGQYVSMKVEGARADEKGGRRCFSLASAPYEKSLDFAMRGGESGFKKNIFALAPGESVEITGAVGKFVLNTPDKKKVIAFLSGGVGITPVRSILRQAACDKRPEKFFLFNSNCCPETTVFLDELSEETSLTLTVVNTITDERIETEWEGERGYIGAEMIRKNMSAREIASAQFYIVGAAGFLSGMKEALSSLGVSSEKVVCDNFG